MRNWSSFLKRGTDILLVADADDATLPDEDQVLRFCGVTANFGTFVEELERLVSDQSERLKLKPSSCVEKGCSMTSNAPSLCSNVPRIGLTRGEAAEAMGVSSRTIDTLIAERTSGFSVARIGARVVIPVREAIYVDDVTLTREAERTRFANKSCDGRPGIERKEVDAELLRLADDVASKPTAPADAPTTPTTAELLDKTPAATKADASGMLDDPYLLRRVIDDVGALGVAGEQELVGTVYLVGVSRLLPTPAGASRTCTWRVRPRRR